VYAGSCHRAPVSPPVHVRRYSSFSLSRSILSVFSQLKLPLPKWP
jgi:hypothetical protein